MTHDPKHENPHNIDEPREDLSFPGRKSLLENLRSRFAVNADVWIHHAYNVPYEDPISIDDFNNIQYQDNVIIPAILQTLIDKVGGKRSTSLSAVTGMKKPDILFLQDPATMNTAIISKERVWITEILLSEATFLFPIPSKRTHAMSDVDRTEVEVFQEDISIQINGHRTKRGIELDRILTPIDSYYRPIRGGKDPISKFKSSLSQLSDSGELVMMISDAISSSAKMYLGTVNVRLNEDRVALEYPSEINMAAIIVYNRYLDVMEIKSPSQPPPVAESQPLIFQVYRTEISRSLQSLFKLLHIK
ncbi:MAG: hypothetical protein EAX86_02410 [Candidatus Heimdallarchaeota archaeon]|nr:hypothetical protein [Candidatus Heimdallarchaeota archaeon]